MSNILTILLTVALGIGCPLVPRPQSFSAVEEQYVLTDDVVISYDEAALPQARLLQGELLHHLGVTSILMPAQKKEVNGIILREGLKNWGAEQYVLEIHYLCP